MAACRLTPEERRELLRAFTAMVALLGEESSQGYRDDVAPPGPPVAPPKMREIEANALEAATGEWVTVAQLAARAGYTANSYFRGAVAALIKDGYLERSGRIVRRKQTSPDMVDSAPDAPLPSFRIA